MKRLAVFAALFAIVAASAAFAEVKDFEILKVNVPAGWTAEKDGNTIGFVKDDSTASMSVTVEENDGTTLEELANAFVKELNGSNLTTDEHGNAIFDFTSSNGVSSKAILNADKNHFALIAITGAENAPDEISAIIDSIQFRDI